MKVVVVILTFALLFPSLSFSRQYRYVKPSSGGCPSEPCHSLEQYSKEASRYFTSQSTFVLSAGNHSLLTAVNLVGTSGVMFKGDGNGSKVFITLGRAATIRCENVTDVRIEQVIVVFFSQFRVGEWPALNIVNSRRIWIRNVTFLGHEKPLVSFTSALNSSNSTITVTSSLFKGNTGKSGGALCALAKSNISLIGCVFIENQAFLRSMLKIVP